MGARRRQCAADSVILGALLELYPRGVLPARRQSHSVLHLCNDHLSQFQAVADSRVYHWRIFDFITIQPDCCNDCSRDELRILSSCRLPRSFETFWRWCRLSVEHCLGWESHAVQQHEHVTKSLQLGRGSGSCKCPCGSTARAVTMQPHSLH